MLSIEQNINKRALIYGINLLGSILILFAAVFSISFIRNLHLGIVLFILFFLGAWAWWNFMHHYIFKNIPYLSNAGISFIILVFMMMLSAGVLGAFHLFCPEIFTQKEHLDIMLHLSVVFGNYILCMEIAVWGFKKYHKIV